MKERGTRARWMADPGLAVKATVCALVLLLDIMVLVAGVLIVTGAIA